MGSTVSMTRGRLLQGDVGFGDNNNDRDNAFWDPSLNLLYFGQGGVNFTPLASIDVVAHEFGHGITDFQIGWTGSGQQRAFNEGLSDIWGAIFESRIRPSSTWRIGEQVTKNKSFLRNLQNTNDGNALQLMADTYLSTQYNSATGTDWAYVRSGVFSHWFYILVNGESGTNDLGNSYSVQGVGIDLAEELIFEAVFNNFLDNTTSYSEIRTAIISAAEATFCEEDPILKSITDAWYAVGVGAAFTGTITTLAGPDEFCTSDTYTLSGLPTGATVAWSANPSAGVTLSGSGGSITVTRAGTFNGKVTLTASITSSCGTYYISKEVQVGTPTPEITNVYVYPEYNQIDVLINTVPGATSYEYYIDGVLDGSTLGSSHVYSFYGVTCGYTYHLSVKAIGPCGPSWEDVDFAYLPCVSPFTVSPNPANESLTITTEGENTAAKSAGNPSSSEFNVKLYNGQGRLLREADSENGSVRLDTQDLPEGTHYLHISRGKETVKRQVVIKH